MASICCRRRIRTCRPRMSRWATRPAGGRTRVPDLKSTLELRPVFHWLAHRIHAHVLLCWLSLLLVRVAERATGQTWRRIAADLGRIHEVTLATDAGAVTYTSALTDTARDLLAACEVNRRQRSPTSTSRLRHYSSPDVWAHASPYPKTAFSQVNPQIRPLRLSTTCGTRASA